ncbi:MAG: 3-deoxy-7-phosphoheptulonate synthase [Firmicutes bacterium]|nr:3-deoxy-7-phosphoheptulonate synthase [Bacillota bacterium]
MIIVMKNNATQQDFKAVEDLIVSKGLKPHLSQGAQASIIGVIGDKTRLAVENIEMMEGVDKVVPVMESYKLAGRAFHPEGSVVDVGGVKIGGKELVVMAGPCAVESEAQIMKAAEAVAESGAKFLRGGAYKPRTSPYAFQGLEDEGYRLLRKAGDAFGLKVVSEVVSQNEIAIASECCDMIQVGARNMQNFRLLRALGQCGRPVLLKRGIASTIVEWLDAAEYILSEGNPNVVLCERGIRTFETATRNTLDLGAVAVVKERSHLPVIVDPSHAAGKMRYVEPLALAAVAAGADGLIVEVHPQPAQALSDAAQQLNPEQFSGLMQHCAAVAQAVGRTL